METNQVTEHLQVIRTLMERSALYRRALAPIMTYCGVLGIAAGVAGWLWKLNSDRSFVFFWSGIAVLALIGAFLLVRRQALKDAEPFWSPPTRRVAQALILPLCIGCFVTIFAGTLFKNNGELFLQFLFTAVWALFYACGIHSAGFFMPRGIKLFGWGFAFLGCLLFSINFRGSESLDHISPHLMMGGLFGGLHLAYGVYLYFTENQKAAA